MSSLDHATIDSAFTISEFVVPDSIDSSDAADFIAMAERMVAAFVAGDLLLPVDIRRVRQIEGGNAGAYSRAIVPRDRSHVRGRCGTDERHPASVRRAAPAPGEGSSNGTIRVGDCRAGFAQGLVDRLFRPRLRSC